MKDQAVVLGNYDDLRTAAGEPFRLNVGNNSHFIVKYDQQLLDDITSHAEELDAISKLQLLQDLRLLAEGNQLSYAEVVPLLTQFADDPATVVNAALYRVAGDLKRFVTLIRLMKRP